MKNEKWKSRLEQNEAEGEIFEHLFLEWRPHPPFPGMPSQGGFFRVIELKNLNRSVRATLIAW